MKKWMLLSAISALFVTAQTSAQSGSFVVRARLTSFEEVLAVSTQGRGEFVARVFSDRIAYRLEFDDLSTTSLFAHIHFGAPATKLSDNVWVYERFHAVPPRKPADQCHTLIVTLINGVVADMHLVNDRAQTIIAARVQSGSPAIVAAAE